MKKRLTLILVFIILIFPFIKGQQLYLGIPANYEPKAGDMLILQSFGYDIKRGGTPFFRNQLGSLKEVMLQDTSLRYRMMINVSFSEKEILNYRLSKRQASIINHTLKQDSLFFNQVDYEILPKGDQALLYKRKFIRQLSDKKLIRYYQLLNSRVELEILEKKE